MVLVVTRYDCSTGEIGTACASHVGTPCATKYYVSFIEAFRHGLQSANPIPLDAITQPFTYPPPLLSRERTSRAS